MVGEEGVMVCEEESIHGEESIHREGFIHGEEEPQIECAKGDEMVVEKEQNPHDFHLHEDLCGQMPCSSCVAHHPVYWQSDHQE